jgi:Asp-tRNA(Asn)/Glu-tRNA(Gln) amidotransferase C subunit
MDFLFHKVSDKEKEEIKEQAKKILDDFSRELSKAGREAGESVIERENCERKEGSEKCDDNFSREKMFENAPEKNDDFIIAEKKSW